MESIFPIMELPSELRTIIYEFVVLGSIIGLDTPPPLIRAILFADPRLGFRSGYSYNTPTYRAYPFTSTLGLLLCSKVVHREFSDVLHEVAISPKFPTAEIQANIWDFSFQYGIRGALPDGQLCVPEEVCVQEDVVFAKAKHMKFSFTNFDVQGAKSDIKDWCLFFDRSDQPIRYTLDERYPPNEKLKGELRRWKKKTERRLCEMEDLLGSKGNRNYETRIRICSAVLGS
ncbi:hypothetical protein KC345_g2815 [Hortaea werneckii]|nr:hypothetical protein KC345_g2815 [Hortaea werneckii]